MSKGTKSDGSKAPLDLIPHDSLVAIAKVLAFGEKKYSAGNWAKGLEYRRLISAAQRHIGEFNSGVDLDEESGESHIAHAACCLLFLLHMEKHRPDMDNRWAKQAAPKFTILDIPELPLLLQAGKRYRRADGQITGPLTEMRYYSSQYNGFYDENHDLVYLENGAHWTENPRLRLVEEVK